MNSHNYTKTILKAQNKAAYSLKTHKNILCVVISLTSLSIMAFQPIKAIANTDNTRYHSPTTKHSAAKLSRHSLAIFVPKTNLINTQQVTTGTDKNVTSINRYTYDIGHSVVSCDGMSGPNKIPLVGNKSRGLNAVVVIPLIPFFTGSQTHTNHSGGYHA